MGYAVRKDGNGWRAVDGADDCSVDEVYSASNPALIPSVADVAATAIAAINRKCDDGVAPISAGYPETEVKTWIKQETEARAWLADNTAAVPLLTAMATSRGITVAELVQRVIAKADAYTSAVGAVVGARQAKEDQLVAIVARNALPSSDVNYLNDAAARAAIAVVVQS